MKAGRDVWWHDALAQPSDEAAPRSAADVDAEHPLFILYTSGSTGKPKGVLHTTRGLPRRRARHHEVRLRSPRRRRLLVHRRRRLGHRAQLHRLRPALQRRDLLHVRGRAELPRLGPLLAHHRAARRHHPLHGADRDPRLHPLRATSGRRRATSRACACSARSASRSTPRRGSGTTASIGGGRCPIVDTWWQTETGAIMMTTLPGAALLEARLDGPAVLRRRRRRRDEGRQRRCRPNEGGMLVIKQPWPSMLRTLWGDDERFRKQYWSDDARRATSPATARAATRTATSGWWAASTTCSTSPVIASAPPRSRARWCRIPSSPRPRRSGGPTTSRGRRWSCSSR